MFVNQTMNDFIGYFAFLLLVQSIIAFNMLCIKYVIDPIQCTEYRENSEYYRHVLVFIYLYFQLILVYILFIEI